MHTKHKHFVLHRVTTLKILALIVNILLLLISLSFYIKNVLIGGLHFSFGLRKLMKITA